MAFLEHYGTPRHSGRYPWGSGKNPQRNRDLLGQVEELRRKGLTEKEILDSLQISSTDIRQATAIAKMERRIELENRAKELVYEKGYSQNAAAKLMGINESSLRSLLDPELSEHNQVLARTADILKDQVAQKGFIDVGAGVEYDSIFGPGGIKETKLKTALAILQDQGYEIYSVPVEQLGTGFKTTVKVLCPPGTEYRDVAQNIDKIKTITDYTKDPNAITGQTSLGIKPPVSIDSSRIYIRYGDEGGSDKDGVVELRKGVDDISLGNAHYAQVRIAVDDKGYMKGMAMYSDDIPAGYDVIYNTNKPRGTASFKEPGVKGESVFKALKDNPDNPFGATINKQRTYQDSDGNIKQSVINIVNEEGYWGSWSKTLSAQFLAKQDYTLIKRQLNLSIADKKAELADIQSITNPVIRKYMLEEFASDCDASAVHLKASALPGQTSKVLLPITDLKDNEIYAPGYEHGTKVCLVRFPHEGIFQIPELTVNNKHKTAKSILGNAMDAVGINAKVAEKLSGADFDGDSVLVIPTGGKVKIASADILEGLKDFKTSDYPAYEGMPKVCQENGFHKQREMGSASNLIMDMTLKGASADELARAVRCSMTIIDAEKHNLDWRRCMQENDLAGLKTKYQGGPRRGASTLLTKANSEERVPERSDYTKTDPATGRLIFQETGNTYSKRIVKKDGTVEWKKIPKTTTSTKMYEAVVVEGKDANELSSGTVKEKLYANYANAMASLANSVRKEAYAIKTEKVKNTAKETYAKEVADIIAKLNLALKAAPRERQAQIIANTTMKAQQQANPDMDFETKKKIRNQALVGARNSLGGRKSRIELTDREWEAINAGAVNQTTLEKVIANSDKDKLKERATPRNVTVPNTAKINKMKAMNESGHTLAEIAEACGVSTSTVSKYLKGGTE